MAATMSPGDLAAPRGAATEPLFASVDIAAAPVSNRECAVRDARSGLAQLLPNAAVEALDLCREFRTLDEHAGRIAQRQPGVAREGVRRGLASLAERGLLVCDADYLAALAAPVRIEPASLRSIVIRACDRPAQLRRLLETLAQYEARHRRRRHYVVLDDSRDAANALAHGELLAAFARETGARTTHVDDARWARIGEILGEARPEAAAALRFAIARQGTDGARFGGGKGYNLACLLGAGARYVLLDDDFLLPLRRPHDAGEGLDLLAREETPAFFHASLDAALGDGSAVDEDPFEHAMRACGAPLGSVIVDGGYRVRREDLLGFAPSRAAHLGADTRVITVTHGHRGHSGAPSSRWMFLLQGESRATFWRDAASYRHNLEDPSLWYGPRRAQLRTHANFTPFAVDASRLLPPTMPGGRSEDLLFGAMTAALYPRSAALHTPLTVGHRQEETRAGRATPMDAVPPVCNQFIAELIDGRVGDLRAADPARRGLTVAAGLRDTAEASAQQRETLIADYLRYVRADMSRRLEAARENAGSAAPDYWRRDIDTMIRAQRAALVEGAVPRFADWGEVEDGRAATQRLGSTLNEFADVLEHWPALFDAAADLSSELLNTPQNSA